RPEREAGDAPHARGAGLSLEPGADYANLHALHPASARVLDHDADVRAASLAQLALDGQLHAWQQAERLSGREVAGVAVGVHAGGAPVELVAAQVGDVGELWGVGRVIGRGVFDCGREVGAARDLHLVLLDAELRVPREQHVIGRRVGAQAARLADRARERRRRRPWARRRAVPLLRELSADAPVEDARSGQLLE